jgi:hypothetical protein
MMNAMTLELFLHQESAYQRERYISQLVKQWDDIIGQALSELAETIWPSTYQFGIFPKKSYQLRTKAMPENYSWSIERDMPPPNQNKRLAYSINLILNDLGQPTLTVCSGSTHYPLKLLTAEGLAATLAQAADDGPLVISD